MPGTWQGWAAASSGLTSGAPRGSNIVTVATNLKDIEDQLRFDLGPLAHVVAGYLTIRMDPPQLRLWTLLDTRDEPTEVALAAAECRLMEAFRGIGFDFTTVHLRGRDPRQFIPEGAYPVKVTHPVALRFFQDAIAAQAHARA